MEGEWNFPAVRWRAEALSQQPLRCDNSARSRSRATERYCPAVKLKEKNSSVWIKKQTKDKNQTKEPHTAVTALSNARRLDRKVAQLKLLGAISTVLLPLERAQSN